MILVELVNTQGKTLAAAMTETGDWERVGTISDAEIPVYRNRVAVPYRIFDLSERANALDEDDWKATRTCDAWRATRDGAVLCLLQQPERGRLVVLPPNGFTSPPGRLLIAEDHLSPDEIADAEKRWQLPLKKETR